jgi:hypothetical protein
MARSASWRRDPAVWLGTAAGAAATAWALFAGRYAPYIDWSNHLGLISVLAHGAKTGALDYLERSLAPSPYLLFYAVTALFAQLVTVDVAAKLSIVLSTAIFVPALASFAEASGRSARLAVIAPLAVFGVSMGYGFGSFVFATPFLFGALGANERAIFSSGQERWRAVRDLAIWLCAAFVAHGFLFAVTVAILGLRTSIRSACSARAGVRAALAPLVSLSAGLVPAVLLALPSALAQVNRPEIEAGSEQPHVFSFEPWSSHLSQLGGHLLERGSSTHWSVMYLAAALFALWLAQGFIARRLTPDATDEPPLTRGPEIYAAILGALFLFGPMSVEWPSSIWYVYPRFGVIAGASLFVIPRARLRGLIGAALIAPALALVFWNAALNADHVRMFSSWAGQYDPVRAAVPPKSRVLALTVVPGSDLANYHPAMGSLYFYHLVDGAAYTAFLFDKPSLPVRSRPDVPQPKAPFWRSPNSYDPRTHGREFDYLVLRGQGLVSRTVEAGEHELVREANGWSVFRTKNPAPRPGR